LHDDISIAVFFLRLETNGLTGKGTDRRTRVTATAIYRASIASCSKSTCSLQLQLTACKSQQWLLCHWEGYKPLRWVCLCVCLSAHITWKFTKFVAYDAYGHGMVFL